MKRFNISNSFLPLFLLMIITSCEKDPPANNSVSAVAPQAPIPPGAPSGLPYDEPSVRSGNDKLVFLPENAGFLNGSASYSHSLPRLLWTKISGPQAFFIENPDALGTKISNLEKGIYEFEITAFGNGTYTSKDTCKVIVNHLSSNPREFILTNQYWTNEELLWGSEIIIPNIYQYMPAGAVFKIYMQRDSNNNWEELKYDDDRANYFVGIGKGKMFIWSTYDETDTPNIKLVF
jgi:hypothetical protein